MSMGTRWSCRPSLSLLSSTLSTKPTMACPIAPSGPVTPLASCGGCCMTRDRLDHARWGLPGSRILAHKRRCFSALRACTEARDTSKPARDMREDPWYVRWRVYIGVMSEIGWRIIDDRGCGVVNKTERADSIKQALDADKLRAWLDAMPPEGVCGQVATTDRRPVAVYLRETTGIDVGVGGDNRVWPIEDWRADPDVGAYIALPDAIASFVGMVDGSGAYGEPVGAAHAARLLDTAIFENSDGGV